MIKKIVVLSNILFLILSLVSVFNGIGSSLIFAVIYAMTISSSLGAQKRIFHYIAFGMNVFLFIAGVAVLYYLMVGNVYFSGNIERLIWLGVTFIALIVISVFNMLYIYTKI